MQKIFFKTSFWNFIFFTKILCIWIWAENIAATLYLADARRNGEEESGRNGFMAELTVCISVSEIGIVC